MLDIYKMTGQKNCGRCGEKSCLAFAAMVKQGIKQLSNCKYSEIDESVMGNMAVTPTKESLGGIDDLREDISRVDFNEAAKRTGGIVKNHRLVVPILGRKFELDKQGNLYSRYHTHQWILGPLLHYVIHGQGLEPTGNWISFREITGSIDWHRFYDFRCQQSFQRIAGEFPDLFLDILQIFGQPFSGDNDADISVLLYPMPGAPFLFSFYREEEGLDARIILRYDECVDKNLGVIATYILSRGLVEMVEKLIQKHGGITRPLLKALKMVNRLTND